MVSQSGSALAIKTWSWQLTHPNGEPVPSQTPYANEALLIKSVKEDLGGDKERPGQLPRIIVIGAVGLFLSWERGE
jgi:saccharopine dehydrogenase (NAD+, L-lysine forming)